LSSQTETSSTNTAHGSPSSGFEKLEQTAPVEPVDITAATLADNLQKEIDARKTERFFWIFACSMLAYVIAVKMMESATATAALFVLLVVFLLGAAAWLGVDHVVILLDRVLAQWLPKRD
jgi:hypothetical protein